MKKLEDMNLYPGDFCVYTGLAQPVSLIFLDMNGPRNRRARFFAFEKDVVIAVGRKSIVFEDIQKVN